MEFVAFEQCRGENGECDPSSPTSDYPIPLGTFLDGTGETVPQSRGATKTSTPTTSRQAKARLVLIGLEDPYLGSYRRDSPTISRAATLIFLASCAELHYGLFSLDAATTVLSGDPSERPQPLALHPPKDLRTALGLGDHEALVLLKAAYELPEAPRAWWKRLRRELCKCGFIPHALDECLLHLPDPQQGSSVPPVDLVIVHVDDLLCGGAREAWEAAMQQLQKALPFGKKKAGDLVYTGIRIVQHSFGAILIDQNEYVAKMDVINVAACFFDAEGCLTVQNKLGSNVLSAAIGALLWVSWVRRVGNHIDRTFCTPISLFDD